MRPVVHRGALVVPLLTLLLVLLVSGCGNTTAPGSGADELAPIVPATTVVADAATRAALEAFDAGSGEMRFASRTPALAALRPDDVLVSEPSPAAPYGYLRQVKVIREEGGSVVLETTQANLTDAVHRGQLEVEGTLQPEDVAEASALVEGLTLRPAVDYSDGYKFEAAFDEVLLDFDDGDVTVKVRVDGSLYFNVGYGVSLAIDTCWDLPPVCVEKFEAWAGLDQRAELHVSGEANAKLSKEEKVAEYWFEPVCVAIGPVPVCFVPRVAVYVGATGEVNLRFDYRAVQTASAKIGARWTDDDGWRAMDPTPTFDTSFDQQFDVSAALNAKAYTKTEAALLLYGVAGASLGAKAELELDAAVPRNPLWILRGTLEAYYSFFVDLPVVGKVTESTGTIYRFTAEFGRASNSPPIVRVRNAQVDVDLGEPFNLTWFRSGEGCAEYSGPFCVYDNEDGSSVHYTLTSDRDGALPLDKYTFKGPGLRTVTVRATDSEGAVGTGTFRVNVINTPPVAYGDVRPYSVPATVPLFIGANSSDPNGQLDCDALAWSVNAPDTVEAYSPAPNVCWGRAVFPAPGTRYVTLVATDPEGASSPPLVFTVNVGPVPVNLPPAVDKPLSVNGPHFTNGSAGGPKATGPIPYGYYADRGAVTLTAHATDPERPADANAVTYTFSAYCSNCSRPGNTVLGSNKTGTLALTHVLDWYPHLADYSRNNFVFDLTFEVTFSDGVNTTSPMRWLVKYGWNDLR